MPAKIPPATRGKILKLRRAGKRVGEIVAELGLGRSTVQRYVREVDREDERGLALDGLSASDVAWLKVFLKSATFVRCVACDNPVAVMTAVRPLPAPTHFDVHCPSCRKVSTWIPES